jgi:hypothetical protein
MLPTTEVQKAMVELLSKGALEKIDENKYLVSKDFL